MTVTTQAATVSKAYGVGFVTGLTKGLCIVKYKVQGMGMVCLILAHKARSLYFKVMFKCQAK